MRVDLFDFELPDELIAQRPVEPRDSARLLVVGESFQDKHFFDLPELLMPGDVVVLNDTRVIPGRLAGVRQAERGTAKVEVTLLKEVADDCGRHQWSALARPAKRLREGDILRFDDALSAEVLGRTQGGEVRLAVSLGRDDLMVALEAHGQMPIPPYLGRPADARDKEDYQTVFARHPGAVAAPTASLHVTDDLMARLEARDISLARVTLHVGAGTFRPVVAADTESHEMEAEWGEISVATASFINQREGRGGPDRGARHDQSPVAGVGGTGRRNDPAVCGGDRSLHHSRLPVQGSRCPDHEFSLAEIDAVHAGLRILGP